ncbi:MAG: hypothetical protein ACP5D2_03205 [Candidatus Nanoarchaeia archaeon]
MKQYYCSSKQCEGDTPHTKVDTDYYMCLSCLKLKPAEVIDGRVRESRVLSRILK